MNMNQKGFANIILVVVIVVLVGAGAYFVSTRQSHTVWNNSKEYFYYFSDEKIPLKFLEIRDGHPYFMTQYSTKAGVLLTDDFIVKIKKGIVREDLEALNRKYNVSIVRNVAHTNDEFVLTVSGDSRNNALDMANLYHNETIVEWSEPNFIQIYGKWEPPPFIVIPK